MRKAQQCTPFEIHSGEKMVRYIIFRLFGLTGVLFVLSIFTFVLMHQIPGGPWRVGERPFTAEQIAALQARYGLDKPLWEQYVSWITGVVQLDFGQSFQHPDESVIELIARTWPVTVSPVLRPNCSQEEAFARCFIFDSVAHTFTNHNFSVIWQGLRDPP